jgi:glycerophosphodiester phosphodiesterase
VGINVEIKMATSAALASTPAHEVDRVVKPILADLKRYAGNRMIILSSFDPDVMLAIAEERSGRLALLRNTSLWFLTTAGSEMHSDLRRMSIPAAVELAAETGLDGIVIHSASARERKAEIMEAISRGLKVCLSLLPPRVLA